MHCDLHTHSSASDGSLTPTELVRAAHGAGLGVLALTDHDTLAGIAEARAAAEALGLILVPGVELSAVGAPGKCHLLGLGVDPESDELQATLARLSQSRRERNEKILARLAALGAPLSYEDVLAVAPPGANIGRPHLAAALVKTGIVSSPQQAFSRFLGDEAAAYVEKETLTPADCAGLIHRAGGLCLVAHPYLLRLERHETLEGRLRAYCAAGADGIEAYYSKHSPADEARLVRWAERYGWQVSGGSDFHGDARPEVALGVVRDGAPLSTDRVSARVRALWEAGGASAPAPAHLSD